VGKVRNQAGWPAGKILRLRHRSRVLADNPWDDPRDRELCVYLPPGYTESGTPFTALWDFAAFSNAGPGHLNWRSQGETLPQRLDRLIHEGRLAPVVVPMPDCYTSLGGNQYLNSPAVGRYADYVIEELVPFLARHVNVGDGAAWRGAFGKSSGGYGALLQAMLFPGVWGAVASHAGDVGFEWVYRPEFPVACRVIDELDGDIEAFLARFWNDRQPGQPDYSTLLVIAMAASYDPDPEEPGKVRLPFRPRTCELEPDRWAQWLRYDPLNMVGKHADALRALHALYIDVGSRDQFNIQYGTRALSARLEELGVSHYFEEFDGTHSGLDWRLDHSLPRLAEALGKAQDSA
jgi:enterochelin esterase-like enzyme